MLISNYLSLDYNMCDQTQLALHIPDEVPLTSRQVAFISLKILMKILEKQ